MGRFFGRDGEERPSEVQERQDYTDTDFQKRDLYKKGLNHMSNDKMLDAIRSFELALRIDPLYVDAWIKKGYSHFHLGE
jgi:Tfp pilus assembly protein PilF